MVAVGLKELRSAIYESSSPALEEMLNSMTPADRSYLLRQQQLLRDRLYEELVVEKLSVWLHIPYKAMGVFYCCQGGPISLSQDLARSCLDEYNEAIASGHTLHRKCHALFAPSTPCRQDLDAWLASDGRPLRDYPFAYVALQEFCLVSLVERRIEQVHALLKRVGNTCTHVLVPYICAKLRESMHISNLRSSADFSDACVRLWRKRNLLDAILQQRFSKSQLERMSSNAKLNSVYQSTIESEYQSTLVARVNQQLWQSKQPKRRAAPKVPENFQLAINYWKATLMEGSYYSLPRELFDAAANPSSYVFDDSPNPVLDALAVADSAVASCGSVEGLVLFQVVKLFPEKRFRVQMPHISQSSSSINVSVLDVVSINPNVEHEVVVSSSSSDSLRIGVGAMSVCEFCLPTCSMCSHT